MSAKNSEYNVELEVIKKLRADVFKLDFPILVMIGLGVSSQFILPFISPVFGVLAFLIFYKKLFKVARYPCPRCSEPFGSSASLVLGIGGNSCQSCSLEINCKGIAGTGTEDAS